MKTKAAGAAEAASLRSEEAEQGANSEHNKQQAENNEGKTRLVAINLWLQL